MKSQLNYLLFGIGAALAMVLLTLFYQPGVAKTGSLLVWLDGDLYLQDIDTHSRTPVGPAETVEAVAPSPGCLDQVEAPCWVAVGPTLYHIHADGTTAAAPIPLDAGVRWIDARVSWSPDGLNLAYAVILKLNRLTELRLYNAATGQTKVIAAVVDPTLPVVWSPGCAAGLDSPTCQLGFKLIVPAFVETALAQPAAESNWLVAYDTPTGAQHIWYVPGDPISTLRWNYAGSLLYSRPADTFYRAQDRTPAAPISPGSQAVGLSPDGRYTVYYESSTHKECQAERPQGKCWYLDVWLAGNSPANRRLIYSADLAQAEPGRPDLKPVWSLHGEALVWVQAGQLLHYEVPQPQAQLWYAGLQAQLTSAPVFSPYGRAVALVDQAQAGSPEYRLLVIDPRLQPLEHLITAQRGFHVLAWLPQRLK